MPKITFQPMNQTVEVESGTTILEAAHLYDIALEGACEGSLACSTCHVIIAPGWFRRLEEATEAEEDILDLAFGVTPTSRLGCQIRITEALDGLEVTIPEHSINIHLDKKRTKP